MRAIVYTKPKELVLKKMRNAIVRRQGRRFLVRRAAFPLESGVILVGTYPTRIYPVKKNCTIRLDTFCFNVCLVFPRSPSIKAELKFRIGNTSSVPGRHVFLVVFLLGAGNFGNLAGTWNLRCWGFAPGFAF